MIDEREGQLFIERETIELGPGGPAHEDKTLSMMIPDKAMCQLQ